MAGGYRIGMHLITSALRLLEPRVDDDFVDRLHYLYTSSMMFLFSIVVSAKQYGNHFKYFHPSGSAKFLKEERASPTNFSKSFFEWSQKFNTHSLKKGRAPASVSWPSFWLCHYLFIGLPGKMDK